MFVAFAANELPTKIRAHLILSAFIPTRRGLSMTTTFFYENMLTITQGGHQGTRRCPDELLNRYIKLVESQRMSWTEHLRLMRLLGSGGQGVVYLSQRRGAGWFHRAGRAQNLFPERYEDSRTYDEAMARMADVAARVSQIQQDNLLDVHNFADRNRIRLMEMEWVDGYDLSQLLTHKMLENVRQRVSEKTLELFKQRHHHRRPHPAAHQGRHRH